MAIGGGTPTSSIRPTSTGCFATCGGPSGLADPGPDLGRDRAGTTTPDRLAVLRAHGVERVSIGVESFHGDETRAMGRPQSRKAVEAALRAIRDARIPVLNIDLIYGAAGQTPARFLSSRSRRAGLGAGGAFSLSPLRPAADRARPARRLHEDDRPGMRAASRSTAPPATGFAPPAMLRSRCGCSGAGPRRYGVPPMIAPATAWWDWAPGARSYTAALHYSTAYAVGQAGIAEIVADYVARDAVRHGRADYGAWLDDEDRRRRFVLMHLLQSAGLSLLAYAGRFGTALLDDLPELASLVEAGLATLDGGTLALTEAGLERSDAIGPRLQAAGTRERMRAFALR